MRRLDLLTNKDINNIRASYNVEVSHGKRHANDVLSVDLWVQECCEKKEENPVLFYKKQGIAEENLEENYFCLVVMSKFQQLMLQKFGHNIIAIDGTHGLNGYDFELTTVMVVDEYHQGFPVAFMFCNRKDMATYTLFFEKIKSKIGVVNAKTFMSDLDESFFKAWIGVMGDGCHSLFCSWHVDRAWQSNLSKITNREKRTEVYKVLKILQQETDQVHFIKSLENSIILMLNDKDTEKFGIYFKNYYGRNYEKWAYCYRQNCGINTNMYLESMHKTIKYFYLERKTVRRLDRGLHVVMKYLRDKSIERIIKITKGKNTLCSRQIFEKHNAALASNYIVETSDQCFNLKKESGEVYVVKKVSDRMCCVDNCLSCKICVHTYTCSCLDFAKKTTVCKHIHYVVINHNQHISIEVNKSDIDRNEFISNIVQKSSYTNVNDKLHIIFNKIQQTDFQQFDDSVIQQINQYLDIVKHLLELPNTSTAQEFPTNVTSVKKSIKPQLRFVSTKRKRQNKSNTFERPTIKEETAIKGGLLGVPQLFISSSPSYDHMYC